VDSVTGTRQNQPCKRRYASCSAARRQNSFSDSGLFEIYSNFTRTCRVTGLGRYSAAMRRQIVRIGVLGITVVAVGACGGGSQSKTSTVTVSVQPTTTAQTAADWKYLKAQYATLLGRNCGTQAAQDGVWAACTGLLNADMDSFYRDAQTLPLSKDRADLLKEIEDFKRDYGLWKQTMCIDSTNITSANAQCATLPLQMSWEHDIMVKIVNNNAGT
jgi:hypothetical protein